MFMKQKRDYYLTVFSRSRKKCNNTHLTTSQELDFLNPEQLESRSLYNVFRVLQCPEKF